MCNRASPLQKPRARFSFDGPHPRTRIPVTRRLLAAALCAAFAACAETSAEDPAPTAAASAPGMRSTNATALKLATHATPKPMPAPFDVTEIAQFKEPWAMALTHDGYLFVTEKAGTLKRLQFGGAVGDVTGVPAVDYGGQGGLGDIALHPGFAENGWIYLSYAEKGEGDTRGAAIARARFVPEGDGGRLEDLKVIWRQSPKVTGRGHFGHRIRFDALGKLWIGSGEREHFDPAQDMSGNLGKVLRLNDDGTTPADNPFAGRGDVESTIWSLGHRNPLGFAFDPQGRLWVCEMGPRGGDELNLIERGTNYGYPIVSNGDHYDGRDIPDHDKDPAFDPPELWWTPVISPGDMVFYRGEAFPNWEGDAIIAALSGKALVRVEIDGATVREAARYDMGERIRALELAEDGTLYLLEDMKGDAGGRLLRLDPKVTPSMENG